MTAVLNETDRFFLLQAIAQSSAAAKKGEYPYGAVLVKSEKTIAEAYNTTRSTQDILAHAETSALRMAMLSLQGDLANCTLYASCEPCAMCAGAIYWSGIARLVYSCPTELDAEISDMPFAVPCRSLLEFDRGHKIEVIGPCLQEQSAAILHDYWSRFAASGEDAFGLQS